MAVKKILKPVTKAAVKSPVLPKVSIPSTDALQKEIEHRAYHIYQSRGDESVSPQSDWARAEHEIRQKYGLR